MSYRHGFLISTLSHSPESPYYKSVIYVCEHAPTAGLGLILNKNLQLSLADITRKDSQAYRDIPIYLGGATQTQERGFVLHKPLGRYWEGTTELSHELHMTTTNDIFPSLKSLKRSHYRVFLGYTSWEPYQLDYEVAQDLWLFLPYNSSILWAPSFDLWARCYQQLGFQPYSIGCLDSGVVLSH